MLNFITKDRSGFHSFKGVPENIQEFDETITFFLAEQTKLDGKRASRQRIANLKRLFDGLAQTRKLAEQEGKNDLLVAVERNSQELEHYKTELESGRELMKEFASLMDDVVTSSDKFIIKAKKYITGDKPQAVRSLEKFLQDNGLTPSDFDDEDVERMRRFEVSF